MQNESNQIFLQISTLGIMNVEENRDHLEDDAVFTMRQLARHVVLALKKYFEAHLIHKVEEIKRSHARSDSASPVHETPAYKVRDTTEPCHAKRALRVIFNQNINFLFSTSILFKD